MIESQLDNAGIAELFDACYSAEQAGALKPAPGPYRFVLGAEDVPPELMVAAHDWDIAGAQAVGLRTVFLTRDGRYPVGRTRISSSRGWIVPSSYPGDRQADK